MAQVTRRGKRAILNPEICWKFYMAAGGDSARAVEMLAKVGVVNPWTRRPFSEVALMTHVASHPEYKSRLDAVRAAVLKAMKS